MQKTQKKNSHAIEALAAIILVAICHLVFWPCLYHFYRADQWWFLGDTLQCKNSFWDLFSHVYSYNRTRTLSPGDYAAFRPLLFGLLCLKQSIFGHQLWWHQYTSLIAYSTACIALFFICNNSQQDHINYKQNKITHLSVALISFSATLYTITNPFNYELEAWGHISGYIFGYLLIFISISTTISILKNNSLTRKKEIRLLSIISLLLFMASLFYEIALITTAGVAIIVFINKTTTKHKNEASIDASITLFPICLYETINTIDKAIHPQTTIRDTFLTIGSLGTIKHESITQAFYAIKYITLQPVATISQIIHTHPLGRTIIQPSPHLTFSLWFIIVIITSIIIDTIIIIKKKDKPCILVKLMFFGLFLIMPTALAIRTISHPDGINLAYMSTYYAFFPISMLASLAIPINTKIEARYLLAWRFILSALFIAISIPNSISINKSARLTATQVKEIYETVNLADKQVTNLISQSRSIAFLPDGIFSMYGIPITTALWGRYENPDSPDFIFNLAKRTDAYSWNKSLRLTGVPKLVTVGNSAHLWKYDGQFFCIPYSPSYPKPFTEFTPGDGFPSLNAAILHLKEMDKASTLQRK